MKTSHFHRLSKFAAALLLSVSVVASASAKSEEAAWWNETWTGRKPITLDTTSAGGDIKEAIGRAAVLVRLHQGNFPFGLAAADGSDLRFVADDGKSLLPFQIESYDSLLNEAFVWVAIPEVHAAGSTRIWAYYGAGGVTEPAAPDAKETFGEDTLIAYHFCEKGAPAVDSSGRSNNAENAGTPSEGSMIGKGVRFLGQNPINIPTSESLEWKSGGEMTWSAWIKPAAADGTGTLFLREEGGNRFAIGFEAGVPFVEVQGGGSSAKAVAGAALGTSWAHLVVVTESGKLSLFVDGVLVGSASGVLPEIRSAMVLGGGRPGEPGFIGELDEFELSRVARPAGALLLAAIGQAGTERAGKLLVAGEDEGGGAGDHPEWLEHISLFGDIASKMMFDGWIAVGLCVLMMIAGWTVAIMKNNRLSKIAKGNAEFLRQWKKVASDLTVMDSEDPRASKLANESKAVQRLMHNSPLYHLYDRGVDEIQYRLGDRKQRSKGLSARSMQAIRASLDAGMVHEEHRLTDGLVFLTFSIAGGPYVGLMGTVVGVMITFAVIAKSGEVEVASIAPGIASALLATVFGLLVAIPSLFLYSYLTSKIKTAVSAMQVFIDEFIAKMAEYYPTPDDPGVHGRRKIDLQPEDSDLESVEA